MKTVITTPLMILGIIFNSYCQDFKQAKTYCIYTDFFCGYGCGMEHNSTGKNCNINGIPVKCELVKITMDSKEQLSKLNGKDTAFVKIYDLNEKLSQTFYCTNGFVNIDTLGNYCSYYPNGKIKLKGRFQQFDRDESGRILYDSKHSLRQGLWTEFNSNGTIVRQIKYNRGVIVK